MIDWLRKENQHPEVVIDGRNVPINIRRHPRAQRLTMRLAPDGSELRVTMPAWGRTMDAIAFANAREEWIAVQLAKVPQPARVGHGETVPYRGRDLRIAWQARGPRKPVVDGDMLAVGGPAEGLERRLRRWLEAEALRLCAEDLDYYCQRGRLEQPDLRLSRAQRRWGSCSGERHTGRCIRINWRLVMAPDHVRRSVVAHEVAHLVHFDHSPAFHALLAQLYEAPVAEADRWLKREGRALYALFG